MESVNTLFSTILSVGSDGLMTKISIDENFCRRNVLPTKF